MSKPRKPKTRTERTRAEREAFDAGHRAGERFLIATLVSGVITGFLCWAERGSTALAPLPEKKPARTCGQSPFLTWVCVLHEGHAGQHEPRKPTP